MATAEGYAEAADVKLDSGGEGLEERMLLGFSVTETNAILRFLCNSFPSLQVHAPTCSRAPSLLSASLCQMHA